MATKIEHLIAAALEYKVAEMNVAIGGNFMDDRQARDLARLTLEQAAKNLPKYLLDQHPAIKRKLVATAAAK